MNRAVVATSLVRSYVALVFKLYYRKNHQSSANYISAYVKVCANYVCVCEGETESGRVRVGYMLSVHNKT